MDDHCIVLFKERGVKLFGIVIDAESVNAVRVIGKRRSMGVERRNSTEHFTGVITMTVILGIALIGMRGETVVQIVLLITLSASLLNFFIGSFLPVTAEKRRHGFEGYSCRLDRCSIDALLLIVSFQGE